MSLVDVRNEWDPLEEVIVGRLRRGRFPAPDRSLHAVEYSTCANLSDIPTDPLPETVVRQTEDELDKMCSELEGLGIRVRRPEDRDHSGVITTPDWTSGIYFDYCPRDGFLTIGTTIIETPMAMRSRYFESIAYKSLFLEYFESGAGWISAPRPRLSDNMYRTDLPEGARLGNLEPCFDAANVLRFGSDILYQVSDSGNELGGRWLQSILGDRYRVHLCHDLYQSTHIDSTIMPLNEGLVLLNPERVGEGNLPSFLAGWEKMWCPEPAITEFLGDVPYSSVWLAMNVLVIKPGLVMVDDRQLDLIRALEKRGIDILPLRLTYSRALGGSFHCVTLDVRRRVRTG